jgi:hypothetical protein
MTAPQRRTGRSSPACPTRSPARTVFSVLLWIVAAVLAAGGILVLVGAAVSQGDLGSAAAAAGFLVLLACFIGRWAYAVARGGRARITTAIGPNPAGPDPIPVLDNGAARRIDAGERRQAAPLAGSSQISYRELSSQFPVLGVLFCGALAAGCVAGLVVTGGPNGPGGRGGGLGGFFLTAGALIGVSYLLFVLVDLPNGVQIRAGRFLVGAMGVPAAGRMWRRVSGPLDSVQGWEVLTREQVRRLDAARRAEARSGRRRVYLGDLRFFGRRQVLRLIIDPTVAQARFPSRVQVGYALLPAARAGAVWDGAVLIGTRHPAALAAALEQALPDRRADTSLPTTAGTAARNTRQWPR